MARSNRPAAPCLAPMPPIAWQWKRFADFAPAELYAVLAARAEVFVVEQSCAFNDLDGLARSALFYPGQAMRIGAQQRLQRFYEAMGFRAVSDPYPEDNIVHVEMLRRPDR